MAFINEQKKEINCKIVFFGPSRCGKSTTLRYLYQEVGKNKKGEAISLSAQNDKTLYFDFLPIFLGEIKGYKLRLHLYTVPGDVGYEPARKLISKGVDGVVFVADSQLDKMESNLKSMRTLQEMIREGGADWENLALAFQYNKRDLPGALPAEDLSLWLNPRRAPEFETVATEGKGLFDTLKAVSHQVLKNLKQ